MRRASCTDRLPSPDLFLLFRRWPATVTRGRDKLGRPWGSVVVLFCYNACLISFSYFALHCTASDVSEAVLNHARFRPWGGARIEIISCRVAETQVTVGIRQLRVRLSTRQVSAGAVVAVWVSNQVCAHHCLCACSCLSLASSCCVSSEKRIRIRKTPTKEAWTPPRTTSASTTCLQRRPRASTRLQR